MKKIWFLIIVVVTVVVIALINVPFQPRSASRGETRQYIHPHELQQGAYCLVGAFQTLGIKADFEEVSGFVRDVQAEDVMGWLLQVAKKKAVHVERVTLTVDELESKKKPAIIKIKDGRFVLIDEFISGQPRIIDFSDFPHLQKTPYLLSKREFKKIWDGEALILGLLVPKSETPQIRFDNARYDFGLLHAGTEVHHTFHFRNDGEAPLIVSSVKTSCACTAGLVSKEKINPGEIGKIAVTYTLSGGRNRKTEEIFVYSNTPRYPVTTLTITGLTKQLPKVIPGSIVFKYGSTETNLEKQVAVTIPAGSQMHITRIETSSPGIEAKIIPNGQTNTHVKLSVSLKSDFKPRFKETLIIYTDHPGAKTLEVPIICEKLENVTVSPSSLLFGMISANQGLSRQVVISVKDASEFQIVDISFKSPHLSTELTPLKEKQKYQLKVTVEKGAPQGSLRDTIFLKTNIPNSPEISIPIYGIVGKW